MKPQPPVILLVRPQLGENIGAVARAMANFGLESLRLITPRDGWPNPAARAMAKGAEDIVAKTEIYAHLSEAVADLHLLYATSSRARALNKPVHSPRAAARTLREKSSLKRGLLFGCEASGLSNDELKHAQALIEIPCDPAFSSLNLAQAVLVMAYEWYQAEVHTPSAPRKSTPPARLAEIDYFAEVLLARLEARGFFTPEEKRPGMERNIRAFLSRLEPSRQEIATLHGILRALEGRSDSRKG